MVLLTDAPVPPSRPLSQDAAVQYDAEFPREEREAAPAMRSFVEVPSPIRYENTPTLFFLFGWLSFCLSNSGIIIHPYVHNAGCGRHYTSRTAAADKHPVFSRIVLICYFQLLIDQNNGSAFKIILLFGTVKTH